ncbi:ATP-grasp domain-containing protein [Pseudomonas sp. CCC3.1]|uniref:ATP-grasp domain-containing protein n=1 Tax=Pseudomonas sp. CCC3.1 TaxID=3048607 RepID=UPI002AC9C393|nr:ATP-grasp domain-containing protein [Pseudomonas sp. CCC3.1]MEB0205343.1 ATP-grasp domain-containing protein [Pseudomonas sp. CCC3.1]WPX34696.1 ATP-grasp domain-containing protein [Pseudomonas sp. CCC3.1]
MIKVLIVDGFSSGKFVAKKLYEDGCLLWHLASSAEIDDYYYVGFDFSIYQKAMVNVDIDTTLLELKQFGADVVVAGAESGVLLADRLNEYFGLSYANDAGSSCARRNKYHMIQYVTHAGLSAAAQCAVDSWAAGCEWIKTHQKFPVVVKPLESAGADGVYICPDLAACERAFKELLGTRNRLNIENRQVLLQEYLVGTEYVVNMVSLGGRQLVTEVVKYQKCLLASGSVVYDIDQLIDSSAEGYTELVNYTRQVVKSLGIKNGPSHAEVMLTENGPVLVEVAARTDGILRASVCAETTGLGQIDALALSITDPGEFEQLLASGADYEVFNHTYNVCLINTEEGVFRQKAFLTEVTRLDSFFEVVFYLADGQKIGITRDVFSQPGTVYLVHPDLSQIESDYARIREMEAAGIYREH